MQAPPIIDLHSHYFSPAWGYGPPTTHGAAPRAWSQLTDLEWQLATLAEAGITAKVLSAPSANLAPPGEPLEPAAIREINDTFADLVAAHPGRLYAVGTIDPFQGDRAAGEVERVVQHLGFAGIVVDCARGEMLLDAPQVRPTLETAAALGAFVFVHPVTPARLPEHVQRLGPTGVLLARGHETAGSVLALLRSGVFDALPDLRIVIPAIAANAFVFAPFADRDLGHSGTPPSLARTRLFADIMGLDPALIRYLVGMLGVEQVLFGSDWPVMRLAGRSEINAALDAAGVTAAEARAAILGGNVLQLLERRNTTPAG